MKIPFIGVSGNCNISAILRAVFGFWQGISAYCKNTSPGFGFGEFVPEFRGFSVV